MTAAVLERSRPTTGVRSSSAQSAALPIDRRVDGERAVKRPKLRVLDQRAARQRSRRRNGLVVLFIVVLVGFFGVALVHAQLVAGQQDLDGMRTRIAEAESHNAQMARAVEEASSPQAIVGRAQELGMVRAYQPIYLEAVVPVRDVQAVPAVAPARSSESVAVAAAAPSISVGISADASVAPSSTQIALAAPAADPPAIAADSPAVAAESPAKAGQSDAVSLGGTSASVPGSTNAGSTVSGATVANPATAAPSSSIAGSRAVTGGSGSG